MPGNEHEDSEPKDGEPKAGEPKDVEQAEPVVSEEGLWPEADIKRLMQEAIPFNRVLGVELVSLRPNTILRIPFRPELVGDSFRPALHGGVISAMLDTACGAAAFGSIPIGFRVSTIDLSVDYVRPAPLKDLEARAWIVRSGNRVVLSHAEIYVVGEKEALATGRAVYSVHQPRP